MARLIKPMALSKEDMEKLKGEVATQTLTSSREKSVDPDKYPVFEVPVNAKVLIYVPNHTVVNSDGVEDLRMDKPFIHNVTEGNRYSKYRCVRGLNSFYPNGCPFCEAEDDSWELANLVITDKCRQSGLDPEDKNNESVKRIRSEAFNARVVQGATRYYTFPIVVMETDPSDIKKVIRDENGNIRYKAMWYTISEAAYQKKWLKTLESLEDEPTHPGGRCFVLDYTYTPKSGEPNKRDSARELNVVHKRLGGFEAYASKFDEETEAWDEMMSANTVYDNCFPNPEDLDRECERVMRPTRDKIAIYKSLTTGIPAQDQFALSAPATEGGVQTSEGMPVLDTDMD